MSVADLNYWKGHHVLAFRNNWYFPAIIYGADNATSRVFVELKTGQGVVSVYDDVLNRGWCHIISDIIPPYEDVMPNVKVAIRIPSLDRNPHELFAPGFVCAVIAQSGRFLVRLYGGQEYFVGVEDLRLMIPPWSPYSTYYLQRGVSYNKPDFFQTQYAMQNQYYPQAMYPPTYPFQEATPQLPAYPEPSKTTSPVGLSANNFNGCQIIEKPKFKTEATDNYGANNYQHSPPDQSVSSSDPLTLNTTYEDNLSFIFNSGEYEAAKTNSEAAPEGQRETDSVNQYQLNQVPDTVKNVTSLGSSHTSINNVEVKRKYNKRKSVDSTLPSVPGYEQKRTRGRKTKGFQTFCNEYRESITASSFDKSNKHISQKLDDLWNRLTEEQKKIYQDKAKNEAKKQRSMVRLNRFNMNTVNYNKLQPLTINTNFTSAVNTQDSGIAEPPLSWSDDSPRLVIDESRFNDNYEDVDSPLFVPKKTSYPELEAVLNLNQNQKPNQNQMLNSFNEGIDARNEVFSSNFGTSVSFTGEYLDCFPGSASSFLKLEELSTEEAKAATNVECDTTTNFDEYGYEYSSKPKTLVGEKFFPPNFSADEVDNDITVLTEKVTRELFENEPKRPSSNTKAKYNLIVQFFKDHGYFPNDHSIEQLLNQNSGLFHDKKRLKQNIREVRQKLLSKRAPRFVPLSPLLKDMLESVMGNPSPLNTPPPK